MLTNTSVQPLLVILEILPKYGNTNHMVPLISSFRTVVKTSSWTNILLTNFGIHLSTNFVGKAFLWIFFLSVSSSEIRKKRLNRCISKCLKFYKLKIIFQAVNRLYNYFTLKDRVPKSFQSNFFYKCKCGSCSASYYGKNCIHIKVRVSEHQRVSPRTSQGV